MEIAIRARKKLVVAGIMSGTSCNGVSTVIIEAVRRGRTLGARFLSHRDEEYPARLREELLHAAELPVPALATLHARLGKHFAASLMRHFAYADVRGLDLVGSHGHTLFHRSRRNASPEPHGGAKGLPVSWQIGEPAEIAAAAEVPVVADFRPADVASGGEGAPLVPFADGILFRPRKGPRACLNIGGIANVTLLDSSGAPVLAFDTGPGVMLLDAAAAVASGGRRAMDRDGRMAARGKVDRRLLARLLAHPYFEEPPPKSTGRELFGEAFFVRVLRACRAADDLLATLSAFTIETIARAIESLPLRPVDLVAAGGGIRNPVLLRGLEARLAPLPIVRSDALGWPEEAREGAAFALLAAAYVWGIPASFPGTTGVRGAPILGKLCLPPVKR
jgi:anhydro-N-acetylmuramic acid kinase